MSARRGTTGLKIRLTSADLPGMAAELRPRLRSGLLFVATEQSCPLGAEVRLLFLYSDGSKALETSGLVMARREEVGELGLDLEVRWPDPLSSDLNPRPAAGHLIEDLLLPEGPVTAPSGAPVFDAAPAKGGLESILDSASAPPWDEPIEHGMLPIELTPTPDDGSGFHELETVLAEVPEVAPSSGEPVPLLNPKSPPELPGPTTEPDQPLISLDVVVEPAVEEISADLPLLPPEEAPGGAGLGPGSVATETSPLVTPPDERPSPLEFAELRAQVGEADRIAPQPGPPGVEGRGPGEVTPLARIALVKGSTGGGSAPVAPAVEELAARIEEPPRTGRVVGLDFGSAGSEVAVIEGDRPRRVEGRDGRRALPTAVYLQPNGRTFVGESALRQVDADPVHGMHSFLRLLGRPAESPTAKLLSKRCRARLGVSREDEVAMCFSAEPIGLRRMARALFKELRFGVEHSLGKPAARLVLVCPSHFGPRQREALISAAQAAGFRVERLISEALAAAIAYGQDRPELKRLLTFDFGAGSLDVAVVERAEEGWRVLGVRGDPRVAGADLDSKLSHHLMAIGAERGLQVTTKTGDLREVVEMGKWALSDQESTQIQLDELGVEGALELQREDVEVLLAPVMKNGLAMVDTLLSELQLSDKDLDAMLPLGGQCAAPLVRSRLQQRFGALFVATPLAHMVSSGAAWAASRVEAEAPLDLQDVLPRSLGVVEVGGEIIELLPAGSPMPAEVRFEHRVEAEEQADLYLFEGGRGHVEVDDPVYRVHLELPLGLVLPVCVELRLRLDPDGRLSLEATAADGGIRVPLHIGERLHLDRMKQAYAVRRWRGKSRARRR